jgi:hypothetical protein
MILWASVLSLLASAAAFAVLGSAQPFSDVFGLVFALSLFTLICASEARD